MVQSQDFLYQDNFEIENIGRVVWRADYLENSQFPGMPDLSMLMPFEQLALSKLSDEASGVDVTINRWVININTYGIDA
jgi:hypothetical protein